MRTISITFVLLGCIFLSSCWRKCIEPDLCSSPNIFLKHINVFSTGNWWVYTNANGVKRDTFYVENYKDMSKACKDVGVNVAFSLKNPNKTFNCSVLTSLNEQCRSVFSLDNRAILLFQDTLVYDMGTKDTVLDLNGNIYGTVFFHRSNQSNLVYGLQAGIGFVLYINDTDTLILTEYHIK